MLTRIRVEPKDIQGATEGPANCPLARAMSRELDADIWVAGDGTYTRADMQPFTWHPLSRAAARWVRRWDDHNEEESRAFLIDVPEEVLHAHG